MAPVRTDECRLCGGKVTRKKSVKDLAYDTLLSSLHEVDVSNDDPAIHPPYVCLSCQNKLKRWRVKKNNSKAKEMIKINIMFVTWESNSWIYCDTSRSSKDNIWSAWYCFLDWKWLSCICQECPWRNNCREESRHQKWQFLGGINIWTEAEMRYLSEYSNHSTKCCRWE